MPPLTYLERLQLAWFLWWRILLTSIFVNLGLGTMLGWWGMAIGLSLDTIVGIGYVLGFVFTIFLVSPWVMGMLPHTQFSGFRVEVVRDGQT